MTSILLLALQFLVLNVSNAYILQPKSLKSTNFLDKSRSISINTKVTSKTSLQAKESEIDETYYDLSLFSPCKINIFLRIINKREDGYHDLASLFQTIGFGDMLYLKLIDGDGDDDIFDCNMAGVPKDKGNLVLKAIDLMRKKLGITDKVSILII